MGCEEVSLANVDEEDALASDHVHHESIYKPSDEYVSVEAVVLVVHIDVAVREDFELFLAIASGGIDGEENGPSDTESHKCDCAADAEESQEEIGIETLVL